MGIFKTDRAAATAIEAELRKARKQWPDWPEDAVHAAAIVAEEAGELVQAANRIRETGRGSVDDLATEAIQTAATAIRFLVEGNGYPDTGAAEE